MKKTTFYLLGIITAFTLILGNTSTSKEIQISAEKNVIQYSHGNTGG
ncbi:MULTISPECIES: hypothetical protein [Bacillus cereus group]|uniref:Phr family secreted Rap phosphatase inhibitor n=1 Tax=Bacillus thuringiensis serovar toumanoffi TaxID=180862 RepID=A0ABD5HSH2_BACTU|nr:MULTISPECIES: hypothetical protein [Bacillus cereus group]MCT6938779.1 hypothetical protein [Acinetobacter baumannii]EEM92355.1 hypothetical protein bthur0013_63130 [Bacillus thuringiensis IBL 200]MCR6784499.1 hypothetical protein [Bacillus thuringiensis]MCR6862853.1 hypothetical protein [Bacillus thuringiensis]MCR6869399.1 hypothetical protein [Bacillus thuringiensis]